MADLGRNQKTSAVRIIGSDSFGGETTPLATSTGGGLFSNLRDDAGNEIATASKPLRTDPTGTTIQPVSMASSPLPPGAATSAKQDTGNASLASIDTKLTSPITVTGPLTDTQLRATPVPVSISSVPLPTGAATAANQVTGNSSLSSIDTKTPALVSGRQPVDGSGVTQPVSAVSLPLPTGAATETTLAAINTKIPASPSAEHTTAASPNASRLSDGTSFYKATTPSDTQPISAASLPLPTGASTSANQTTGNSSLSSIDTKTPALVSGRQPVDGSGVTQPISAVSLPLPTGAATQTTLADVSTYTALTAARAGDLTETAPASDTASSGLNGRLQRIAQRITSLIALIPTSLGQKTMANSLAVTLASDQTGFAISVSKTALTGSSPTAASVGITTASAVASNASRKGLVLTNTSNKTISLGLGVSAVLNSGITLLPGGVFVMDEYTYTTAAINAIAGAAASNLAIQEFT